MNALRVFVADVDPWHISKVREVLAARKDLVYAGSALHGSEAFGRILAAPVDVLLLDLQLPGIDGCGLLRALNRQPRHPLSIVCTQFYSSLSVAGACQCGAAYFLYNPLDYICLPEIILQCCRASQRDLNARTGGAAKSKGSEDLLTALGFDPGLKGTHYLTEAMAHLQRRPELMRNLSRGLYPAIAVSSDVTPKCVERAMRNAIAIAHERGSLSSSFPRRPSNRELFEYLLRGVWAGR